MARETVGPAVGALEWRRLEARQDRVEFLVKAGFVRLVGGMVKMGTDKPLFCKVEGHRHNETPVREVEVGPFWICKTKLTNGEFEHINPNHRRPSQALAEDMPVVDVMYGEAITFCKKINELTGMGFRLPTEPEWVFAAAPQGWEYPHGDRSDVTMGHVYGDGREHSVAPVLDPRWKSNWVGLDQMGYNVSEMTAGHYHAPIGQYGAETDGMYCIIKGGNYGHCKYGPGVHRRGIFDIADRNPRVGFRLAHDDL